MASFRGLSEKEKQYTGRKLRELMKLDEAVDEAVAGTPKSAASGRKLEKMRDFEKRKLRQRIR